MPKLKSPELLRTLCLKNVVDHMDKIWCADYRENYVSQNGRRCSFIEGPFNSLNQACIKDISDRFVKAKIMSKMYLHLLIVPNLKEIDFSGCPKLITDEIVDLVCTRCRGITKVNMEHCDRVSARLLLKLVHTFGKSLSKLIFIGTKITNEILEAIGQSCVELTVLAIDMCKVNRKGMELLFYKGAERTLTPAAGSLKVVRMMGCTFQGDVPFIADLLLRCPTLRCVTHFSIWESIAKLCEDYSCPSPLKLTGVRYDMSLDLFEFRHKASVIPSMAKILPEIRHLSVHDVDGMNMELFHLLSGCGKKLKSLKLDWVYPYDFLHYIGLLYPDLDTLGITVHSVALPGHSCFCDVRQAFEDYISKHGLRSRHKTPWQKLSQFSMSFNPTEPVVPCTRVLLDIFKNASSSLSSLDFDYMNDDDVDSLILRAMNAKYFENLEVLRMNDSLSFTIEPVLELIMNLPKLKSIGFGGCEKIDLSEYLEIDNFVKENNYAINVEEDFY